MRKITSESDATSTHIPANAIKKQVSTDILVIGAGNAGLMATASAAQLGTKTVLLQKLRRFWGSGGWIGALNSRVQKVLGIEIDRDEIIAELCRWATYRNDQQVVTEWADKSGETIDWLQDLLRPYGLNIALESDVKEGFYKSYPIGHYVRDEKGTALPCNVGHMPILEKKALEWGADIYYKTPALELIKSRNDRITGVIAQGARGQYIRFNVKRAVIICSGGYQQNIDMLKEYCPRALNASDCPGLMTPGNTGDGIKMGLGVNAAIDELPHAPMQFDLGAPTNGVGHPWTGIGGAPHRFNMLRQPWLRVNLLGERYVNEDLPYSYNLNAAAQQPGCVWWCIWDANWQEGVRRFHTTVCARIIPAPDAMSGNGLEDTQRTINKLVKAGLVKKANTIEDLAHMMKLPVATFKSTVNRYNYLAKMGKDMDFGKIPSRLSTLEKPPFYALKGAASLLITLNGLRINNKMQVLDKNHSVIPGLYAAGDVSGSMFANDYPNLVPGLALGRALTFGRLAALNAIRQTI